MNGVEKHIEELDKLLEEIEALKVKR